MTLFFVVVQFALVLLPLDGLKRERSLLSRLICRHKWNYYSLIGCAIHCVIFEDVWKRIFHDVCEWCICIDNRSRLPMSWNNLISQLDLMCFSDNRVGFRSYNSFTISSSDLGIERRFFLRKLCHSFYSYKLLADFLFFIYIYIIMWIGVCFDGCVKMNCSEEFSGMKRILWVNRLLELFVWVPTVDSRLNLRNIKEIRRNNREWVSINELNSKQVSRYVMVGCMEASKLVDRCKVFNLP